MQMRVPAKSASGTGPFSVDHLDVYAVTIAPGAVMPANRDLLKPEHVVGTIAVQPPLDPDAPEPETPDPRPRPGDVVTFTERLTAAQMTPERSRRRRRQRRRPGAVDAVRPAAGARAAAVRRC